MATKKVLKTKIQGPSKKAKLIFIIPDVHFPEHDETAVGLALEAHRILHPDETVLLGDLADAGLFSTHPKRSLIESKGYSYTEQEVKPINKFLDTVQKNTKDHTYYLEGNHEQRIERFCTNNGHLGEEIYNYISPYKTFIEGRKNITYVPYCKPDGNRHSYVQLIEGHEEIGMSGLVAVHGWSYSTNAAGIHLNKSRSQSIVFGHCHRSESKLTRDPWSGAVLKSWCPGTLSKLQALYHVGGTPSDWSWGFSLIYVGTASWTEYSIPISPRGQCVLPDGREIKING